jgi:hypothetical protein
MTIDRQRKLGQVGARALAALCLISIGYAALTRSIGSAYSRIDPDLAGTVSGYDARIKGLIARSIAQRQHSVRDEARAVSLAQQALARDPTVVAATVALGTLAGLKGDESASGRWFKYAQVLSRRDLWSQLYFIESSVQKGDIAKAMMHYDIALRTSEAAPALLFPVLRGAVSEPAVRTALARILAAKPLWSENFISDLASKGPDFPAAASLFLETYRRGAPISASDENVLLNNLIGQGRVADAWQYYSVRYPLGNSQSVRNEEFDPSAVRESPFDWRLSNDSGVTVSLDPGGRMGVLNYRVVPSVIAQVVSQVILLRPGKYRLSSNLLSSSQLIGHGPYWLVECADGSPIARLEMGGRDPQRFERAFAVPPGCLTQRLTLAVRSSDDVAGAEGTVDTASIVQLD